MGGDHSLQLVDTMGTLEKLVHSVSRSSLIDIIGNLERLKAITWARMVSETRGDHTSRTNSASLLNMRQVAERLNIPLSRAYELARQGKLPAVHIGKYVRVSEAGLQEYQARLTAL
jgi:excisionase family DNA binding protein